MKKSALIIGSFQKTEHGFTGKIETLAINASVTFEHNEEKAKDIHPDYIVLSGGKEIAVAWERSDDRGSYISVSPEEPSLAPGFYTLVKSGVEKGYQLLYRRPMPKKDGK